MRRCGRAAHGASLWSAFCNSGQACVPVERVYAHEAVHDELVELVLAEEAPLWQGGAE